MTRKVLFGILLLLSSSGLKAEEDKRLLVFAAASLQDVITALGKQWAKETNRPEPVLSIAASAIMARQISSGAPADIFLSANTDWTDMLIQSGKLQGPRTIIAGNKLVLAVPKNYKPPLRPTPTSDFFIALTGHQRLTMADPQIAPAGAYAQEFLENLGAWGKVKQRVAYGSNVRQTLLLIEKGGLAGFVYMSDVQGNPHVKSLFTLPEELHTTVQYSAALSSSAPKSATDFLAFIRSLDATTIWKSHGFSTMYHNETIQGVPK